MKKALPALLVFSFLLAGCNKSLPSLFNDGDPVDETQFLPVEIPEQVPEQEEVIDPPAYQYVAVSSELDYTIVNSNFTNVGLVVGKNAYDRIGFFSLLHGKFIVEPQFVEKWLNYDVYKNNLNGLGYLIKTHYEDEYAVYDPFGNKLLEEDFYNYKLESPNGHYYLSFKMDQYDEDYDYIFKYKSNGEYERVYEVEEEVPVPEEEFDYQGPKIGTVLNEGRYLLDEYGFTDYSIYVSGSGLINVYNKDTLVTTFYVDLSTYAFFGFIGDKMVFQRSLELPIDATDYTYSSQDKKYELNTILASIETGEKESKEIGLVLENIVRLKKLSGATTQYSYVVCRLVDELHVLGDRVAYIVNGEFQKCNDVSGSQLDQFIKLKNGYYYNVNTKYLYDKQMNVVTNLEKIHPIYNKRLDAFEGTYEGYKGLVNNVGKVSIEFKYHELKLKDTDTKKFVIGRRDNNIFRIEIGKKAEIKLGTTSTYFDYNNELVVRDLEYHRVEENLFKSSEGSWFTSETNLFDRDENYTLFEHAAVNYFGEHTVYYVGQYYIDPYTAEQEAKGGAIIKESFVPTFNANGEEQTVYQNDGYSANTPVSLQLGLGKLHAIWSYPNQLTSDSYAKFIPTESGYYSVYTPQNVTVSNTLINGNEVYQADPNVYNLEGATFVSKATVYLEVSNEALFSFHYQFNNQPVKQMFNVYLAKEVGTNSNFPIEIETTGTNQNFYLEPSVLSESSTYYVRLHSNAPRRYTFASSHIESVYYNYENVTAEGLFIGLNLSRLFRITLRNRLTSSALITLNAVEETANMGYSEDNPYFIEYGLNNVEVTFTPNEHNATSAYLAYIPRFEGRYSYDLDVSAINTVLYVAYLVNADGQKSYISESPASSYFSIPEGCYLLVRIYTENSDSLTMHSHEIDASDSRAFEKPDNYVESYATAGSYTRYFTLPIDDKSTADYALTFSGNDSCLQYYNPLTGKFVPVQSGDVIPNSAATSSRILFKLQAGYNVYNLELSNVLANPTEITFINNEYNYNDSITASPKLFYYRNNTESYQNLTFHIDYVDNYYFRMAYVTGDSYIAANTSFSYVYSGDNIPVSLAAGEALLFAIKSAESWANTSVQFTITIN